MKLLISDYSNLGPISHRVLDTVTYWLKNAIFSYPVVVYRPRSGWLYVHPF